MAKIPTKQSKITTKNHIIVNICKYIDIYYYNIETLALKKITY